MASRPRMRVNIRKPELFLKRNWDSAIRRGSTLRDPARTQRCFTSRRLGVLASQIRFSDLGVRFELIGHIFENDSARLENIAVVGYLKSQISVLFN